MLCAHVFKEIIIFYFYVHTSSIYKLINRQNDSLRADYRIYVFFFESFISRESSRVQFFYFLNISIYIIELYSYIIHYTLYTIGIFQTIKMGKLIVFICFALFAMTLVMTCNSPGTLVSTIV